jgi:hypothetical protein
MYRLFLPPNAAIRSIHLSNQSNFFSSSYRPAAYMLFDSHHIIRVSCDSLFDFPLPALLFFPLLLLLWNSAVTTRRR